MVVKWNVLYWGSRTWRFLSKGIWENTSQLLLEESAIQLIYETE